MAAQLGRHLLQAGRDRAHADELPELLGRASVSRPWESDGSDPFTIGDLDTSKPFVHVFDDISLDLVMQELDTVDDFIGYLTAKAAFARSGRLVSATGEEVQPQP